MTGTNAESQGTPLTTQIQGLGASLAQAAQSNRTGQTSPAGVSGPTLITERQRTQEFANRLSTLSPTSRNILQSALNVTGAQSYDNTSLTDKALDLLSAQQKAKYKGLNIGKKPSQAQSNFHEFFAKRKLVWPQILQARLTNKQLLPLSVLTHNALSRDKVFPAFKPADVAQPLSFEADKDLTVLERWQAVETFIFVYGNDYSWPHDANEREEDKIVTQFVTFFDAIGEKINPFDESEQRIANLYQHNMMKRFSDTEGLGVHIG